MTKCLSNVGWSVFAISTALLNASLTYFLISGEVPTGTYGTFLFWAMVASFVFSYPILLKVLRTEWKEMSTMERENSRAVAALWVFILVMLLGKMGSFIHNFLS